MTTKDPARRARRRTRRPSTIPRTRPPELWHLPTEHLEALVAAVLRAAGVSERALFAFERTGRLLTLDAAVTVDAAELAEWIAALEEHDARTARLGVA